MTSPTIRPSTPVDAPRLLEIWEAAVRATHHFLTEADIDTLRPQVRAYVSTASFELAMDERGTVCGFLGMTGSKIDSLFVHPEAHGHGLGRALVDHAAALHPELTVDVNEQNPGARAFYARLGFEVVGRSETDDAGRPFPLLHLRRVV
ncbi:acetyltransferase [Archangium violaceum]|uniref:acetyltransferase n=1 Tax=Archangium violaceum TaxID=83451 RepID=UPI002B31D951|nr:acetyltransferase [Archangium gephyra]